MFASELFDKFSDLGDPDPLDGNLRGVDDLIGSPGKGSDPFPANPHDGVQDLQNIIVDPDGVGFQWTGKPAVFDQEGIPDHSAREIPGGQPVDGIRIPDATNVESVSDERTKLPGAVGLPPFENHIGRDDAGRDIEVATSVAFDAEAVAWDQGLSDLAGLTSQLFLSLRIAKEPLGLVEVAQQTDQLPPADEIGATSRKAFTGNAFAASQTSRSTMIVQGHVF